MARDARIAPVQLALPAALVAVAIMMLANAPQLVAQDGVGVLWTTHLVDEVKPDDSVVVLHKGRVLAADTASVIMEARGAASIGAAFAKLTGADRDEEGLT